MKERKSQLIKLGFSRSGSYFLRGEVGVNISELFYYDDEEWGDLIKKIKGGNYEQKRKRNEA